MEEVKSSRTVTYRNHDGVLVTYHYGARNVKMEFGDKAADKKSE